MRNWSTTAHRASPPGCASTCDENTPGGPGWLGYRARVLRLVLLPIVTVVGLGFALLVGGVVVTESVFAIPGIGRLTVESVIRRDYPVAQGIILIVAGVYVLINVVIDILYVVLDPRIRY